MGEDEVVQEKTLSWKSPSSAPPECRVRLHPLRAGTPARYCLSMRCPRNWECGTWHLDFFSAISTAEVPCLHRSRRETTCLRWEGPWSRHLRFCLPFADFCPWHVLTRRPVHGHRRLPSGGRHNLRSGSTPSTLAASTVSGHPNCVEKCQRYHSETGTSVRSMKTTNKSKKQAHTSGKHAFKTGNKRSGNTRFSN